MIRVSTAVNKNPALFISVTRNAIIIDIETSPAHPFNVNVFIPMDDVIAIAATVRSSNDATDRARLIRSVLDLLTEGDPALVDLPEIPPSAPPLPDIPSGWTG